MRRAKFNARLVTMGLVACMLLSRPTPAGAAWGATAFTSAGTMGMASIGYTFTPIQQGALLGAASGTGGATYVSTSTGVGATVYVDLTSTSSVSANPSVSIANNFTASLSLWPTMAISSCPVAWNTTFGTCTGGATTVAASYLANTTPSYAWGAIAPGSTLHMQVTMGGALGNVSMTAVIGSSTFRAGTDRTAG